MSSLVEKSGGGATTTCLIVVGVIALAEVFRYNCVDTDQQILESSAISRKIVQHSLQTPPR
jgi:hypothetical protein